MTLALAYSDDDGDADDLGLAPMPGAMPAMPMPSDEMAEDTGLDRGALDEHHRNLIEDVPDHIMADLIEREAKHVEDDRESRADWDEIQAEGLAKLGLDRRADKTSEPFPGASRVVHPLLMQTATDIHARLMRELFPASGPVRTKILGRQTPDLLQRAARVRAHMNDQLTRVMKEFREEQDAMTMQLPIIGSCFKKPYWDSTLGRPRSDWVAPEEFIVPYASHSLERAPRYCHVLNLPASEVKRNQIFGLWDDFDIGDPTWPTDESRVREVEDRIQGEAPPALTTELPHQILEMHIDLSHEAFARFADDAPDGLPLPFILTVHKPTMRPLSLRRNWDMGDWRFIRRNWFVHYKFLPWRGFYGIGLLHLIGGIGNAATGALRALLNMAQIRTVPGGIRLKGGRASGGTLTYRPMEFTEVDAPGVRDVKQIAMAYPLPAPDPSLMTLLEFLDTKGTGFAAVATGEGADPAANIPVGTMLAHIEQRSMVYGDVYARQHASAGTEYQMIGRLEREHMDDEVSVPGDDDEVMVTPRDYDDMVHIIPVSDPQIYSEIQRSARSEAKLSLAKDAKANGVPVDMPAVYRDVWATFAFGTEDDVFKDDKAKPLDPIGELKAIQRGDEAKAFPGQNHPAHAAFLQAVLMDPAKAPLVQQFGPQLQALLSDHILGQARAEIEQGMGQPLPPDGAQLPPEIQWQISQRQAQIEMQLSQQRQQAAAQAQGGQPGGDPSAAMVGQAALQDVQRKAQADQAKAQGDMAKLQAEMQRAAQEAQASQQAEMAKLRADMERAQAEIAADNQRTMAELANKLQIAREEASTRERIADKQIAADMAKEHIKAENALRREAMKPPPVPPKVVGARPAKAKAKPTGEV